MGKYIAIFAFSLTITLPLMSIYWFTWEAWLSISILMTIAQSNKISEADNLSKAIEVIYNKLDKIEKLITDQISRGNGTNDDILAEMEKIRELLKNRVKK